MRGRRSRREGKGREAEGTGMERVEELGESKVEV